MKLLEAKGVKKLFMMQNSQIQGKVILASQKYEYL